MPKRASKACHHCRFRRLRCSEEIKDEPCLNCRIHGARCIYPTIPSSSKYSKRQKQRQQGNKETSKSRIASSISSFKPEHTDSSTTSSMDSPESKLASQTPTIKSPVTPDSSDLSPVHENMLLSSTMPHLASRFPVGRTKPYRVTNQDGTRNGSDQYANFLIGVAGEAEDNLSERSVEEPGLSSQRIMNALNKAYAKGFKAGIFATQVRLKSLTMDPDQSIHYPLSSSAVTFISGTNSTSGGAIRSPREYAATAFTQKHDMSFSSGFDSISARMVSTHKQEHDVRSIPTNSGISTSPSVSLCSSKLEYITTPVNSGTQDHYQYQQHQGQRQAQEQLYRQRHSQRPSASQLRDSPKQVPPHHRLHSNIPIYPSRDQEH